MKQQLLLQTMWTFLVLIQALGPLEFVPSPWYINIDSNQFININMIYDNLRIEKLDALPQLHAITSCNTASYKFNVAKCPYFQKAL